MVENVCFRQKFRISEEQQMLLGTCHCHVQLSVNQTAVRVKENVVGQEVQLIVLLHGEAVENVFPL